MFSTLSLLETVQKLAATNKSLRSTWTDKANQVKAVAQLLLTVQPGTCAPGQLFLTLLTLLFLSRLETGSGQHCTAGQGYRYSR